MRFQFWFIVIHFTTVSTIKVDKDSLCGYYIPSEVIEADKRKQIPQIHFGSCNEERHYIIKKAKKVSEEEIKWADLLKKGCNKCTPVISGGKMGNTTYWGNKTRQIYKWNSQYQLPPRPIYCVAVNGTEVVYLDCKDEIGVKCKRLTEGQEGDHRYTNSLRDSSQQSMIGHQDSRHETTTKKTTTQMSQSNKEDNRKKKEKRDPKLVAILFVCIGCVTTLLIVSIVAFVCFYRRIRRKRAHNENNQQPEVDIDNDAEYDYITEGELCKVSEYYRKPVDAVELAKVKVETDNYVEPYDSKQSMGGKKPNEQASVDMKDVPTANAQELGESVSGAHAYKKVIIRPTGEDATYDVTTIYPKKTTLTTRSR